MISAECQRSRLRHTRRVASRSRALPATSALRQRTRDAFLRFRDGCPDNACIAETYRGRMREIRDIMLGTWRPGR